MNLQHNLPNNSASVFGGEPVSGIIDLTEPYYPEVISMIDTFHGSYWTEKAFKLDNDSVAFHNQPEHVRELFTSNLQWQIVADSIFAEVIGDDLSSEMSNVEYKTLFRLIADHENLHARSYSYIVQSLYPNPSLIFKNINESKFIRKRILALSDTYSTSGHSLLEKLMLNLFTEGLSFPVSFMITAIINREMDDSLSNVNGIIKDIEQEEGLHVGAGLKVLKTMTSPTYVGERMFGFDDMVNEAVLTAKRVKAQEMAGLKALSEISPLINVKEFEQYLDHKISDLILALGIQPDHINDSSNLPYLVNLENYTYKSKKETKTALQETEGKYSVGQTVGTNYLNNFKL